MSQDEDIRRSILELISSDPDGDWDIAGRRMLVLGQDVRTSSPICPILIRVIPRSLRHINHSGQDSLRYDGRNNHFSSIIKYHYFITTADTPGFGINGVD